MNSKEAKDLYYVKYSDRVGLDDYLFSDELGGENFEYPGEISFCDAESYLSYNSKKQSKKLYINHEIYETEANRLRDICINGKEQENIFIMSWSYLDIVKDNFSKSQLYKYINLATYDPRYQPYGMLTKKKNKMRVFFDSKKEKYGINRYTDRIKSNEDRICHQGKILIKEYKIYASDYDRGVTTKECIFAKYNVFININRRTYTISILMMIINREGNVLNGMPNEIFNIICEYYMGCDLISFKTALFIYYNINPKHSINDTISWKD